VRISLHQLLLGVLRYSYPAVSTEPSTTVPIVVWWEVPAAGRTSTHPLHSAAVGKCICSRPLAHFSHEVLLFLAEIPKMCFREFFWSEDAVDRTSYGHGGYGSNDRKEHNDKRMQIGHSCWR
jgi:hypothetical protein